MTRFYGGLGGSGSGSRFGGSSSREGGSSSSSLEKAMAAKNNKKVKSASSMSADERYQALIKQKMESHKAKLMQTKSSSGFQLPGTKPADKEMSKSAQLAMELIAAKMAKRDLKKAKPAEKIIIKPQGIGGLYGGWIDAKGNVWDAHRKKVLKIDIKTGDIKTTGMFGRKIGKYDPKSHTGLYKIQQQLEKHALKTGNGASNIWGQQAGAKPASDPNSIYGNSGGWGGGSDDGGNKGWW